MTHARALIHRSLENDLAPEESATLEAHLRACEQCRAMRAELSRNDALLSRREPLPASPPRRRREQTPLAHVLGGAQLALVSLAVLVIALTAGVQLAEWRSRMAPESGVAAPGTPPAATGRPTPPVDPREQTPPAPKPFPTSAPWPARDAQEVAGNMLRDPFVAQQMQDLVRPGSPVHDPSITVPPRLGTPVYVKGFNSPLPDVWLTPVLSGDRTVAVFSAAVRSDGTAAAGFYSGFTGPFPHPLARGEAIARASTPSDPGVAAELMWSNLGARQGLLVGLSEPFWRVTTSSGAAVLVLNDGSVMRAEDLR